MPSSRATHDRDSVSTAAVNPMPVLGAILGALVLLIVVAGVGGAFNDPVTNALAGASAVVSRLLTSGALAAAALLAAYGYGRLCDPLTHGIHDRVAARWGLGLAVWFTLLHLLGWMGVLTPVVSGLVTVGGLALAVVPTLQRVSAASLRLPRLSPVWLGVPGVVVLLVASSSPPGWLWASEFGGYDALSYHLPLAREWIAFGAVRPLEHSVYSFLPSYAEVGFMHLGQLVRLPGSIGLGDAVAPDRVFLAHGGLATYAAQFLHAGLVFVAARAVLGVVRAALGTEDPEAHEVGGMGTRFGGIGAAIVLVTPWVVVVGSLAYNELGVVALGACALLVAMSRGKIPAFRRGVLAGLLTGAACGFKPTALVFVAPGVGMALLMATPARAWIVAVLGACLAGLVMLAPWLIRNTLTGGNPVFPQLTGLFGTAHWDAEQAARYAAAHAYEGGVFDRLRLLVWTDPGAGADAPTVERFRGFAHPQWSGLALLAVMGAAVAWIRGVARRAVAVLAIGLALQVGAWLTLTHLQSRFLLPSVPWLVCLVALGCAGLGRRAGALGGGAVVVVTGVVTLMIFLGQGRATGDGDAMIGSPNAVLVGGVEVFAGPERWWRGGFDARFIPEDTGGLGPERIAWAAAVNGVLPAGSVVLLVGDATPFYVAGPVVYATTYDRSMLAEAMIRHPGEPGAWTRALRARGVTHVVVSPGELARLHSSGWLDPVLTAPVDPTDEDSRGGAGSTESLRVWLDSLGPPMLVWDGAQGRALFALPVRTGDEPTP